MEADRELRRLRTFSRGSSALLLLITAVMVFLTVVIALGVAQILSDTPSFEEQFGMTFWQTVCSERPWSPPSSSSR